MIAAAQNQLAVESESGAGGSGLTRVIGLQGADRQHRVGTLRTRLAEEELQLAQLVAAEAPVAAE